MAKDPDLDISVELKYISWKYALVGRMFTQHAQSPGLYGQQHRSSWVLTCNVKVGMEN